MNADFRFGEVPLDQLPIHSAARRKEQRESERIGQDSRCQQQCSSNQNHAAIEQFVRRHPPFRHGLLNAGQRADALLPRQPGAQKSGEQNQAHGVDDVARPLVQLKKQRQFNDRNGDEQNDKPSEHGNRMTRVGGDAGPR